MFPWHRRYTQSGLPWPFCALNVDLNLLKWIERGHRCKRVVFLGSETPLRILCSDDGYIAPQCSLDLFIKVVPGKINVGNLFNTSSLRNLLVIVGEKDQINPREMVQVDGRVGEALT